MSTAPYRDPFVSLRPRTLPAVLIGIASLRVWAPLVFPKGSTRGAMEVLTSLLAVATLALMSRHVRSRYPGAGTLFQVFAWGALAGALLPVVSDVISLLAFRTLDPPVSDLIASLLFFGCILPAGACLQMLVGADLDLAQVDEGKIVRRLETVSGILNGCNKVR